MVVDEVAAAMSQAVAKDRRELAGQIAVEAVTHLDRWLELGSALAQNVVEILAGVLAAGQEQGDAPCPGGGDDAGGEDPRPLLLRVPRLALLQKGEDAHGGVVCCR